jgi:hypothetical protein
VCGSVRVMVCVCACVCVRVCVCVCVCIIFYKYSSIQFTDKSVLNLAKSEVQIQYRYGEDFIPSSVLIVTWENTAPNNARNDLPVDVREYYIIYVYVYLQQRNLFQIAVILSRNGTFAHMIYSKLKWNDNAIVC